jgi:hypothetical protein
MAFTAFILKHTWRLPKHVKLINHLYWVAVLIKKAQELTNPEILK